MEIYALVILISSLLFSIICYIIIAFLNRDNFAFWTINKILTGDISGDEKCNYLKEYEKWSDKRWNNFKKIYEDSTTIEEFVKDIEMLRALK